VIDGVASVWWGPHTTVSERHDVGHDALTKKNHRGVYTLIIRSAKPRRTKVGGRLLVFLKRGLYLYTGSALGRGSTSLEGRISRHLSRKKKSFWHIDWVLSSNSVRVITVIFAKTKSKMECRVNTALLKESGTEVPTRGVGSSDCRCKSHFLLARRTSGVLRRKVRLCYARLGLRPRMFQDGRIAESAI
jgi:Uri superfamily endonuclease